MKSWVAKILQSRTTVLERRWFPRPTHQPGPISPHLADFGMCNAHFRLSVAIAFHGAWRPHVILRKDSFSGRCEFLGEVACAAHSLQKPVCGGADLETRPRNQIMGLSCRISYYTMLPSNPTLARSVGDQEHTAASSLPRIRFRWIF